MPSYGGYDIRRPFAPGAMASVHEAASSDGIAGRFALKIFHPPPSTKIRRLFAVEGWLLVAERQQRAAKAGKAALEVLAWGRCEEGAYVVLPWCEGSFEALVESLSPRGDSLRVLTTKLLDVLEEWESTYGIPHGKLTPSNVFVEGTGPLATRTLRLSDSWYMPGMKADELRRRDLAAIGEMLVRVVRRRAAGGWPIEDAPEWKALGRAGSAWREYCNFLLDPKPSSVPMFAEARARLQKIPHDVQPARTAALTMAAMLVLGGLGLLGFARFGSRTALPTSLLPLAEWTGNPNALRTEVSPEWAQLARAFNTWIGDVERNTERWDGTAALWTGADDPLRKALTEFRAQSKDLDPRVLVPEAAGNSLGVLADSPPDLVRAQLLRELVNRRVQQAWDKVNAFSQKFAQWPGWVQASKTADQLAARGRPRVAGTLRQRLPPAPVPGERTELTTANRLKAFNDLSQDQYGALVLLPRWKEFEAAAAELAASGDRVQAAMPKLALASAEDTSSLGDFSEAISAPIAELHRRRQEFKALGAGAARFVKEAPIELAKGDVTAEDLPKWEQQLALFTKLPAAEDPRAAEDWDERIHRMAVSEAELETESAVGDNGVRTLSKTDLERELTSVRSSLTTLRARDVLRVDRESVTEQVSNFRNTIAGLEQRLEVTLALLKPERWLDSIAKQTWRFEASQARWAAWRQRDMSGVTAASLTGDRAKFTQLRQIERGVHAWLEDFEGKPGIGGLETPAMTGVEADTVTSLQALDGRLRDQLSKAVLDASPWPDNRPPSTWAVASTQPKVAALLEAQRRWLAGLPDFGRELDKLGALLASGFGWTEGVADSLQKLSGRSGVDTLEGRAGQSVKSARRLEQIAASSDRVALFAASKEDGLSVPLTAWRRLGSVPGWPLNIADLDVERTIDVNLRNKFNMAPITPERRDALVAELSNEMRARWMRAAKQAAGSEATMSATFQRMSRFGLTESDLDGALHYNYALWQIKSADWNEGNLGRLRQRRDAFVSGVRNIPEMKGKPEVEALVASLTKLGLRDDAAASAAVTPRRLGWTEEYIEGGQRVIVSWPGGRQRVELEFQLVLPTDGTSPFYLSRRAIAVGEFIDQVNERPDAVVGASRTRQRGAVYGVDALAVAARWPHVGGQLFVDLSSGAGNHSVSAGGHRIRNPVPDDSDAARAP
jgi:hypothetical protein